MSFSATYRRRVQVLILGGWVAGLAAITGCGPQPATPPNKAKAQAQPAATNAVVAAETNVAAEYVSVFEDLPSPKGRDPFYPYSHRRDPAAPVVAGSPGGPERVVDPVLVLKAIIHTRTHSQAVINNEILEVGETGPVRVPNGKIKVTCLEIGADYVLIRVAGEAGSKKLMMEKKNN
jgi:hypothetical protein